MTLPFILAGFMHLNSFSEYICIEPYIVRINTYVLRGFFYISFAMTLITSASRLTDSRIQIQKM